VAKDLVEAAQWLRKAAEQNYAVAQYYLGSCYIIGQGVAKDEVEAVKWYRKAAEQNDANGQYNLGVCYANGLGVAKDLVEAAQWVTLAAAQDNESAKELMLTLDGEMSRQQLAEGKRRANEWLEQRKKTSGRGDSSSTGR
jgi:TPR repeat protein